MRNRNRAIIAFLFVLFTSMNITKATAEEINQFDGINLDSICNVINAMPFGNDKFETTINLLYQYNFRKESDKLLSILRNDTPKFKDKDKTIQLYFYEALAAKRENNLERAKEYVNKIKNLCTTEEDYEIYFNSITIIVHETILKNKFEEAYDIIQKAKEEAKKLNNKNINYLVTKCLIYFYNDTGNYQEEKKIILQAVKDTNLKPIYKREFYNYLANVYIKEKNYQKALGAIDKSIKYDSDFNKNSMSFAIVYQSTQIKKLEILLKMNDLKAAKKTIDTIDNRTDTALMPKITKFNYVINLTNYYYKLKDYDKAFEELSRLNTKRMYTSPYLTKQFYLASILYAQGKKKEGAELFVKTLEESLAYKTEVINSQREVSKANTIIQKMLLDKEKHEERNLNLSIIFGITILLILGISIYRFIHVGKELRRTVEATQKAALIAKENDIQKDHFLKNMTQDIELPLNKVNKLTELLSNNENISADKKKEYTSQIKKSSKKLLHLINNILDLSRLESGMMKFTIDNFDIVHLCEENINKARFKYPKSKIEFIHPEKIIVKGDITRFNKLIYSLICSSGHADENISITMKLSAIEKSMFSLTVNNSPLLLPTKDIKEQSIQSQINSLFVEIFNGSYYVDKKNIFLTMPLDNIPKDIIIVADKTQKT